MRENVKSREGKIRRAHKNRHKEQKRENMKSIRYEQIRGADKKSTYANNHKIEQRGYKEQIREDTKNR
jgi:hypothetical protein